VVVEEKDQEETIEAKVLETKTSTTPPPPPVKKDTSKK
jgi:hypothetical protein